MADLGLKADKNNDDYKTKFLSELKPGDEIEGEIHIGDIKRRQIKNKDVDEFFVIITNHETQERWICGIVASYYPKQGNIYGEKEGRVYTLIDSLNHTINKTPRNVEENYSVIFNVFKDNINKNVDIVKIRAIQSWKPGAKAVNLDVIEAKLKDTINDELKINKLSKSNNAIKLAFDSLDDKRKEINKKSVAFELKYFLDKGEIARDEFKTALKELDKL